MEEAIKIADLVAPELVLFDVEAQTKEELIRKLAGRAEENGYVVQGYAGDVIEREQSYPTALPTAVMKVAVPHAIVQDHVLKAGIVVGRLAQPVAFKEMGDGVRDVDVECAFMLVAKGDKHHLSVLQRLIGMLADQASMEELKAVDTPEGMVEFLVEKLDGKAAQ